MSQETLRQMDLQWEERLNQSMRSMEQRFMEQLQEQKEIQRGLEEKLHSMTQGNMGAAETPTPPRFTRPQKQSIHDTIIHEDDDMAEAEDDPLSKLMTKLPRLKKAPLELYWDLRVFGIPPHVPVYITLSNALEMIGGDRMLNISIIQLWCMYMDTIVVEQGRSSMYGFVEPQTIQPSGNTLQNRQQHLQTWMDESKRDVYLVPYIDGRMKHDLRTMLQGVIGKSRGQLVQILYSKNDKTSPTTSGWKKSRPRTATRSCDARKAVRMAARMAARLATICNRTKRDHERSEARPRSGVKRDRRAELDHDLQPDQARSRAE
ncbi:hypothetical protein LR48_Vigan08g101300 [Vigna angularis]|uniref:Uncharacterized protein n=1 Tax=Phaseolus angularis TaxID=3914 RepID=A0A0L9V590_PHAAN|nr:hypothetical protein LR48_Vigan08g101300 [Vigna angularis]